MRSFLLCLLVLALDVVFALAGSRTISISLFSSTWGGVPVSIWAGIAGIVFLVALTFLVSLRAFPAQERAR